MLIKSHPRTAYISGKAILMANISLNLNNSTCTKTLDAGTPSSVGKALANTKNPGDQV